MRRATPFAGAIISQTPMSGRVIRSTVMTGGSRALRYTQNIPGIDKLEGGKFRRSGVIGDFPLADSARTGHGTDYRAGYVSAYSPGYSGLDLEKKRSFIPKRTSGGLIRYVPS